ncbi:hypothetical protein ACF1GW_35610 [Streptomyces achromogenes]|uniref:hypothetical protein n=1 Tax=Streptomyces achromogenes TaxID=67255 RepID=UPI0036F7FBD3
MKVTLELGTDGDQVDITLPAVPRIGDQILWCDEATDEHGTYERQREYHVRMVDWTLSPTPQDEPFILVRLDLIADVSGSPVRPNEEPSSGDHDFQRGDDHVQRCTRCQLPHARWAGGPCPGPEHPFRPGEYV